MTRSPDPSTEALRKFIELYVPVGYRDEDGVWHDGPQARDATAALDTLAARLSQAEEVIAAAQKLAEANAARARGARFWTLNEREALAVLRDSLAALAASSAGETDA